MRMWVRSLALLSGSGIWLCCGVGHGHDSDPVWLWLWLWRATTAPIRPLAWEPPYVALKSKNKQTRKLQETVLTLVHALLITLCCFRLFSISFFFNGHHHPQLDCMTYLMGPSSWFEYRQVSCLPFTDGKPKWARDLAKVTAS